MVLPLSELNLHTEMFKAYGHALFRSLGSQASFPLSTSESCPGANFSLSHVSFLLPLCALSIFPQTTQENRGTLSCFALYPSLIATASSFTPQKWPRAQGKIIRLSETMETACSFWKYKIVVWHAVSIEV